MSSVLELDCSPKCRSLLHGYRVVSAFTRRTDLDVLAYLKTICSNYAHVSDAYGRCALHMASSMVGDGRGKVVEWLLKNENADHKVKDRESGWTPLHRSLYYGCLSAAKVLIEHGASLTAIDNDGYTPLELVINDRPRYVEFSLNGACEAYVWGCNTNFNLGLEAPQSRKYPEVVEAFRRQKLSLKQVVMAKYHTIFLTHDGEVYICGHGQGGRIGHDSEQTSIAPVHVKLVSAEVVVEVAAGTNHTVFLTESGTVWTCGLNTYHQLGHVPPPPQLLTPKPVKTILKGVSFTGICAARFHTVLFSKEVVLTFGLNAGQLGHPKGDRTQITPRQVSSLNLQDRKVHLVAVSDGATVCSTDKGDVYVLHEYRCRKIVSKHAELKAICAVGGNLDAKADASSVLKEHGGQELKIVLLGKTGTVYLWQESVGQLSRCIFCSARPIHVIDVAINTNFLLFVSNYGEAYQGVKLARKGSPTTVKGDCGADSPRDLFSEKEECERFQVKKLQRLHRSVKVTCDPKGRNFAVIQSNPALSIFEFPEVQPSEESAQYAAFLKEADLEDSLHDVVFLVGSQQFPAHKFILSSRSDYFNKQIQPLEMSGVDDAVVRVDGCAPVLFEQIMKFVYSDTCDFLKLGHKLPSLLLDANANPGNHNNHHHQDSLSPQLENDDLSNGGNNNINDLHATSAFSVIQQRGKCVAAPKKTNKPKSVAVDAVDPVRMLADAANKMGLQSLAKLLDKVEHVFGIVTKGPFHEPKTLKFNRRSQSHLYDVCLQCEDGREVWCHKCVLTARSEYFHRMLACGWLEASTNEVLQIPVSADVLEVVVDYLYTDESEIISKCEDKEFICKVLMLSDQLLIGRLKQICEKALADLIYLRDATELLELSCMYQAKQLQSTCKEFICINLATILEANGLSVLSDEALDALTETYRRLVPALQYRVITPYADSPTDDEMRAAIGNADGSGTGLDALATASRDPKDETQINLSKKPKSKRKHQVRKTSSSDAMSVSPSPRQECVLNSRLPTADVPCEPPPNNETTSPVSPDQSPRNEAITTVDYVNNQGNWTGRGNANKNPSTLQEIMFAQEMEEAKSASVGSKFIKKGTKLSQKQRKKMAHQGKDIIVLTPPCSPLETKQQQQQQQPVQRNPWQKLDVAVQSLDEIMEHEKKTKPQMSVQGPPLWKHCITQPDSRRAVPPPTAATSPREKTDVPKNLINFFYPSRGDERR